MTGPMTPLAAMQEMVRLVGAMDSEPSMKAAGIVDRELFSKTAWACIEFVRTHAEAMAKEGREAEVARTQLALYQRAVNRIDDRIEYRQFTRADIHEILAELTKALADAAIGAGGSNG